MKRAVPLVDMNTECSSTEGGDIARYFARAVQTRTPLAASFELTHRCNFHCVHCYLGDQVAIHKHQNREVDTNTIIGLLDEMVEAGTLYLHLTGGDPMLRPDFVEIYQHAVRVGLLVTVFCNGSLITEEIVNTFSQYPPRMVEVTVYGATRKTFETITQKKGAFDTCMKGIHALHKANVHLRLKTMVMTLNVGEFELIRQMAQTMGLEFRHDCSLNPALPNSDNGGRTNCSNDLKHPLRFRLSPEQAAAVDRSVDNVALNLAEKSHHPDTQQQSNTLFQCGAGQSHYHINPYGQLQPCLIIQPRNGDLLTKGIQSEWSRMIEEFNLDKAVDSFLCNTCPKKQLCTACPGVFALTSGNPEQVDPFYCLYADLRKHIYNIADMRT